MKIFRFTIFVTFIVLSIRGLAQGGYAYPGNFDFKPFLETTKSYNYTGIDFLAARNLSPVRENNFNYLQNSVTNWSYLKLSKRMNLFSQVQRTDEILFKDQGLTKNIISSLGTGFQWHPDTCINLNNSKLGLVGYQDFGIWLEKKLEHKSVLYGMRMRDYSNIYALNIDTGSIANRYTSNLNTGTEYEVFIDGEQLFLGSNSSTLGMLILDPTSALLDALTPNSFLILADFKEVNKINDFHEFEYSLIGIPIFSNLRGLLDRKISLDWGFSGINLNRLDSILPDVNINRDTTIGSMPIQLNSSQNLFKPSQEIHFAWTYSPFKALRFTGKYSYFSHHLYKNSNFSLSAFQNHGKNLQILTRVNFSSEFGNWNEIGIRYKPFPGTTIFLNTSGGDIFRFKETIQFKKNFKILHLSLGLFANL